MRFGYGDFVIVGDWVIEVIIPVGTRIGVVVEGPHNKLGNDTPSYTVQMPIRNGDMLELFCTVDELQPMWLEAEVWDEILSGRTCLNY